MARVYHLVVLPAGGPVSTVALGDAPVRVGSSPECEVHLADPDLAPVHARLEPREGGWVLSREALPLLVNGLRAKDQLLAAHDLVVLGKNAIAFRPGPPPAPRGERASRAEPTRRLAAFAERVLRGDEPGALAEALVTDVVALTGASRGTLARFAADDDPVRVATATSGSFSGGEVALSRTLLARMRVEDKAILVASTAADPSLAGAESLHGGPPQAAIAAPITHEGRVLGAVYVSGRAGTLGAADVELVESYANVAVGLLEAERKVSDLAERLTTMGSDPPDDEGLLLGSSTPMRELRRTIAKAAASSAPVLLSGETGTGKELAARELHKKSPRARGPFVAVNCGAIPPELLASELFGHKRGAFTHAQQDRLGYFRAADGGTLFLDEIGEMPLAQQVALLRALQEGRVTPVGAEASVPVDVRLVCATNRALEAEVAAGRFRQDLFFRVAVLRVTLPPLRDRGADVLRLANVFLRAAARARGAPELRFSDDALAALTRARWEGNVRELEGAVQGAAAMVEGGVVSARDLGLAHDLGLAQGAAPAAERGPVRPLSMARDEFLRAYVREVVERFGGNRTAAAEALVVTPRTVFKYLEE